MNSLNILHISDAHIQLDSKEEISEIVEKLIDDVLKVQSEKKIKIDFVCFTGDLIQRGDKAVEDEEQLQIAQEFLITPLVNKLGLSISEFLIVPGNHEVDISKIVKATEKGLLVNSLEDINDIVSEMDDTYLTRLAYFYTWIDDLYDDIVKEKIGYVFLREIHGKKIGVVCVDSAWRSSGKGEIEKGLLYVGLKQIKDLYKHVKDADIKICMMHHPTDWLSDYEIMQIEKELAKFDIVLCGHVHENDHKLICRQKIKTIYSTAGKLYPLDYALGKEIDGYNGYSILNMDLDKYVCNIFLRTYFGKNRGEFDSGINLIENGQVTYNLNKNDSEKEMEFNIIKGIQVFFTNMSEKLLLIKEIDTYSPSDIEQVFVDPLLSEESEYVAESSGKCIYYNIDELIDTNDNIIVFGKKESGKTTILQNMGFKYIESYDKKQMIPIYIDMGYLPKKSDKLTNASIYFVMNNMYDNVSIKKEKVRELIADGKIVFLIDNINSSDYSHIKLLTQFLKDKKGNRFILTMKEEFFQSIDIKKLPDCFDDFKALYINSFGKAQVRELVTKWASKRAEVQDVSNLVEKINGYCESINFAKTPFNISIFMILWDFDNNFVPQNEGIVMENYLEILLEKLSPKESERSNYSFKIKQHFLSNLAYAMFKKNKYYFTKEEFEDFIYLYHREKGYKVTESKFLSVFFDKGILSISDDRVVFSHTSFLEFYLAEYARNNEDFLNVMIQKGNRIYFKNEICFYSGLVPDCKKLLDGMADTIIESIIENIEIVDKLNNIEIIADFKIKKEELIKKLEENRPTQKEIDLLEDSSHSNREISPEEFGENKSSALIKNNKKDNDFLEDNTARETEDFYALVYIYGSILKNAELLDNVDKVQHLENYMYAMNILLGQIFSMANNVKKDFSYQEFIEINTLEPEKLSNEDFEKSKELIMEMIKVVFPIAIQHVILENVGTPKLEIAIDELMDKKEDKPFEKFMLEFLKCDMNLDNIISELHAYIKKENSRSILKLIFIKLLFYYRMRFFGNNRKMYNSILDLIIEIYIKMNSKDQELLSKAYKGNKAKTRRELGSQIDKNVFRF